MSQLLEVLDNWEGFAAINPKSNSLVESKASRLVRLIANADGMPSYRHQYLLREVITTDDFPQLFGFTLQRDMMARYRAADVDWQSYCAIGRLPNFNPGEIHKVMGNDNLLPPVVEKGEYLVGPVRHARYLRQLAKYGRQFDISWEAMVNDALGAFSDVPQRMAEAVTYTRAYHATQLFSSAAGPNVLLFGAPITDVDGQLVTNVGTLALTITNLETTLNLMAMQTDVNGRPLGIQGIHLVVPPALKFTALAIAQSTQVAYAATAAAAIPLVTANVVSQVGIKVHVNPLLPIIDLTANANTTWYLFAEVSQGKAIQMDFLDGATDPEICMKSSDKVAIGGGLLSPMSGDFATDNVFYRVRDVHGGTQLDPRNAYAQDGTT